MTAHHTVSPRVVVIGGGYSGIYAANHLRLRSDLDITVVNPRPHFVERIRLHQFAAGTHPATVDYGSLLGSGIRLVVDTATRIDTDARRVELRSGDALDYDYLMGAAPRSTPTRSRSSSPPSGCGTRSTPCSPR